MSEQLPIQITASGELIAQLPKLNRAIVNIEAQLNFQSMTSGWYSDEENILAIEIQLFTQAEFDENRTVTPTDKQIIDIADDVRCSTSDKTSYSIDIAITANELTLLNQHPKLVEKICSTKARKVTNLIAADLSLPELP